MLKMTIDNEEVVSDKDITINEEMLSASSTILNNVYPKEWEEDKDYTSRFYYPQDYSKAMIQRSYVTQEAEAGTTIQVNGSVTLTDVDTTKNSRVLRLLGQTSQTGAPTPSSPIPVNVVSGDNEINVCGKNLLSFANYTNISGTSSLGVTRTFDGETIILNGTTTSAGNIVGKSSTGIILKAGTYTGSITTSGSYNRPSGDVAFYLRKNNTTLGMLGLSLAAMTTDGQYSSSFILTEDTEIFLEIYTNASNITFNNYICKFQIENGFSATDFVQYQSNTYNIDLGVENKFNKDQWYNQRSFLFGNNRATMSEDGTITSILPSAMDFAINVIPPMSATATQTQIDQVNAAGFDISNLENITISLKNANSCKGQILALFYKADYGYISIAQQDFTESNVVKTFGVPSNAKYLCLRFDNESYNTTPTILKIEDIQIEAGTKANSYTPYGTTPIELCKIGNYQDYIYKDSNKWYLHKEIGKVASYNGETITTSYISTTGGLDTGATVYYLLATSTDTEITYTELLNQLNDLESR